MLKFSIFITLFHKLQTTETVQCTVSKFFFTALRESTLNCTYTMTES